MAKSTRRIALLRGINVGGNNKLPMADLRACLEDAGFEDIKTYIQSGNVALSAPSGSKSSSDAAGSPEHLSGLIEEHFGLTVPVVVRTQDQLNQVVANNPFPEAEAEPKYLMVYFCSASVSADSVAAFDHDRFKPDRLAVAAGSTPGELYVAYSEGLSKSKLTNAVLDRHFGVSTTARNWNTVLKLQEMASG